MKRLFNHSLKPYNTFGIHAVAGEMIVVENADEVSGLMPQYKEALVLGGGSNVLLLKDEYPVVIHMKNKGKQILSEDDRHVLVRVEAGEVWNDFVQWALEKKLGGIENLVLIPGQVGTAPVQNIGAYGREVKDVITKVETIDRHTGKSVLFRADECRFAYRHSIFKERKNRYLITAVHFRLDKPPHRILDNYGSIRKILEEEQITRPGIRDIARIISRIRRSKLPDPAVTGNAGSFFKNPVVDVSLAENLRRAYADIPLYPVEGSPDKIKLAAGWLIDKSGLKGYTMGEAAVHDRQALVLINRGNATGEDIAALAEYVRDQVREKFGVELSPEVSRVE